MKIQGLLVVTVALAASCSTGDPGLRIEGTYQVRSTFRQEGIPSREAPELVAFTELADHPDRVEQWILDRLEDEVGDDYRAALASVRADLDADAELKKYLSVVAPDYKASLVELAIEVDQITQTINLHSEMELDVDSSGRSGLATHYFEGIWIEVGHDDVRVDFGEVGARSSVAAVADFEIDDQGGALRRISFGQQSATIPYGRLLDHVVNDVLVERRDPFADSLAELIGETVPCAQIGELLRILIDKEEVPAEVYGTACAAVFGQLGRVILPGNVAGMVLDVTFEGDARVVEDGARELLAGFDGGEGHGTIAYPRTSVYVRRGDHVFDGTRSTDRDDLLAD